MGILAGPPPKATFTPPRNSRPYDQGLLTPAIPGGGVALGGAQLGFP